MAFMSGLWNSIVGGNDKEENWHVQSVLFIDKTKKYFTVSEVDKEETVVVFGEAHNISFNKTGGFGIDYTPLNFVSIYHIDSRKGLYFLIICVSFYFMRKSELFSVPLFLFCNIIFHFCYVTAIFLGNEVFRVNLGYKNSVAEFSLLLS